MKQRWDPPLLQHFHSTSKDITYACLEMRTLSSNNKHLYLQHAPKLKQHFHQAYTTPNRIILPTLDAWTIPVPRETDVLHFSGCAMMANINGTLDELPSTQTVFLILANPFETPIWTSLLQTELNGMMIDSSNTWQQQVHSSCFEKPKFFGCP